jgi:dTDP-4-dehydrorhamnose 3,5-epimerase-like enzyme
MMQSTISQARLVPIPTNVDPRGALTVVEGGVEAPFEIKRIFYMWNVSAPFERGSHAHWDTEQFVICVAGTLRIDLSDPHTTEHFYLDDPTKGLYIPPMLWTYLYEFTPQTVCLAAASTHYDHTKVIRDWDAYCRACEGS